MTLAPRGEAGLETSVPAAEGVDPAKLEAMYRHFGEASAFGTARSLLVVRHGRLVAEGYFNGWTPDRRQHVKSVTKSVLSLLIGIAIDQGRLRGVEQPLVELLPTQFPDPAKDDPRRRQMRLEDLLTMRSGIAWVENMEWLLNISWHPNWMFASRDSVKYVLSLPMEDVPGGHLHYSTGSSQLLAGALRAATGQTPREFAIEHLFSPLGIPDVKWQAGANGLSYGGVRLWLTPRELAKVGQLCLQRGQWQGRQLVSAEWIARSTAVHAQVGDGRWKYGYHWWIRPHGYAAEGYGGQFVYVLPEHDVVLVITADEEKPWGITAEAVDALVAGWLLPALRP